MHVTNPLHVTDAVYANKVAGGGVFVTTPSASTSSATVSIKTNVINESTASKNATVVSRLLDAGGQMVGSATSTASVAAGANADVTQMITVSNPRLWHPNTPVLYTLATEVQDGGAAVDNLTTRIGIRRIGWSRSGGLTINGSRFKALGVNMLEEVYGVGNAVSDQSIYYDVKRIRDAGLTFIRGAHYPHAPAFYDACDALGVLVMDAQTGWQYFNSASAFVNASYQELREMIRRDRNHPSIVVWEANLNESQYTDAWAQMAHSIVHAEYPGDQAFSGQYQFTRADIFIEASQHNVRTSTDTRAIIINEYGDWDYGGVTSTSRQAREAGDAAMLRQSDNVQDGQGKNIVLSWFSADGYWQWSDYGGYQGISRSGLVDMHRLPKFAYYFLQSQRDPGVTVSGVDSGPMVLHREPLGLGVADHRARVQQLRAGVAVRERHAVVDAIARHGDRPPAPAVHVRGRLVFFGDAARRLPDRRDDARRRSRARRRGRPPRCGCVRKGQRCARTSATRAWCSSTSSTATARSCRPTTGR